MSDQRTTTIRAIIFDFDGLILDTETMTMTCWQAIYAEHNQPLPREQFIAALGRRPGTFSFFDHLNTLCGNTLDQQAIRARRKEIESQLLPDISVRPGIADYLSAAKSAHLLLAVASSSSHSWVDQNLIRLGLYDYFQAIICGDDTAEHKPLPAPYLAATRALGIAPAEAIALEDSPNGITSARAAGLFAVAVPNDVTRDLDLSHADMILDPLPACTLNELLTRANFAMRHRH